MISHVDLGVAVAFHLLYFGAPALLILTPVWLLWSGRWALALALAGAYAAWTFDGSERRSGRDWPGFCNMPLWRFMWRYFDPEIVRDSPPLDPAAGPYVFGVHPHGSLAFNRGMFAWNRDERWDVAFPGIETRDLVASAALRVPVIREIWLWSRCIDASRKVAARALDNGFSLWIYPGGEAEQMETVRDEYRVVLSHKGFLRLALRHGAPVVPVFVFGETSLFRFHTPLLRLRKWIVRKLRVAVPLISGRLLLLPFKTRLVGVSGPPIPVPELGASGEPTEEQVEALHAAFVKGLREVFEKHRGKYAVGGKAAELVIVDA